MPLWEIILIVVAAIALTAVITALYIHEKDRKKLVAKAIPKQTLDEAEAQIIRDTMASCGGNLTLVAKELGISRPTLYSKLKKYDI